MDNKTKAEKVLDFLKINKDKDTSRLNFRAKHYDYLVDNINEIIEGKEAAHKYSTHTGMIKDEDFGNKKNVKEQKSVVEKALDSVAKKVSKKNSK